MPDIIHRRRAEPAYKRLLTKISFTNIIFRNAPIFWIRTRRYKTMKG